MRIIYLHQYFATPDMAGSTRSYEMARRLVAWGHEVHMITSRRSGTGRDWEESVEAGIRVHWCPVAYSNHMGFRRRLWAFLDFSWRAARRAAATPADMVLATSTPLTIALPAVHAARRRRIPMVFEVRDLWPDGPIAVGALRSRPAIALARWLERSAYRNAAHVIALSPGMRDGVVASGYPRERVTMIPNSCDFRLFDVPEAAGRGFRREYPWLGRRPLVAYTGTVGIANGVDYLARLAAAVATRDPEIRFLVVGDGGQTNRVRRVAAELGVLDRNFFMLPELAKARIPAVLSAADLAVSTFLDLEIFKTNSPNKVFDALAAGRPIVVNHRGWLADLIRQADCGLVLDAHDFQRAAGQMVTALEDHAWLKAAGARARQAGKKRFDREALARRLESILLATAGQQRHRKAA